MDTPPRNTYLRSLSLGEYAPKRNRHRSLYTPYSETGRKYLYSPSKMYTLYSILAALVGKLRNLVRDADSSTPSVIIEHLETLTIELGCMITATKKLPYMAIEPNDFTTRYDLLLQKMIIFNIELSVITI